jgi:hypothetical protein
MMNPHTHLGEIIIRGKNICGNIGLSVGIIAPAKDGTILFQTTGVVCTGADVLNR